MGNYGRLQVEINREGLTGDKSNPGFTIYLVNPRSFNGRGISFKACFTLEDLHAIRDAVDAAIEGTKTSKTIAGVPGTHPVPQEV